MDFAEQRNISSAGLYFYKDGEQYKEPDDFYLEYWYDKRWQRVREISRVPIVPAVNTINIVTFKKVATTKFRFIFNNRSKKLAIAVVEIQLY